MRIFCSAFIRHSSVPVFTGLGFTTAEIFEEIDKSQEEYKGVRINKLEVLPSMEDNHHHDTIIFHDIEDPFLQKESAQDDDFKFFEFISPTISTWVQHVLQEEHQPISIDYQ